MLSNHEYYSQFEQMQTATIDATRSAAMQIRVGMSEGEIAHLYEEKLTGAGLMDRWYPTLIYCGESTGQPISRRFHLPSPDVKVRECDIIMLDSTPLNDTTWSNWAETFCIGNDPFFEKIIDDTRKIVNETYEYAIAHASTIGDIYDFCQSKILKLGLTSLDPRHDVGHSIFQVPIGQTVDKTPMEDRVFISEEFRNTPLVGILSIEPQLGRIDTRDGKMYSAKMQKVVIFK